MKVKQNGASCSHSTAGLSLSVSRVGRWEEAPQEKGSEATAAHKGMKDVVSSKPPLYRPLKAL